MQQQHHDRAITRTGVLGRAHEVALLILVQRSRRVLREALPRHDRGPKADLDLALSAAPQRGWGAETSA